MTSHRMPVLNIQTAKPIYNLPSVVIIVALPNPILGLFLKWARAYAMSNYRAVETQYRTTFSGYKIKLQYFPSSNKSSHMKSLSN